MSSPFVFNVIGVGEEELSTKCFSMTSRQNSQSFSLHHTTNSPYLSVLDMKLDRQTLKTGFHDMTFASKKFLSKLLSNHVKACLQAVTALTSFVTVKIPTIYFGACEHSNHSSVKKIPHRQRFRKA